MCLKCPYSYASENTHLITVSLGNDQGVKKIFFVIGVIFCVIIQAYCYMQYHAPGMKMEINNVAPLPDLSLQESVHRPEEMVPCGQSYTCQEVETKNWGKLRRGERCLGFHTREYSANLLDLPLLANWKDICESSPIEIHGNIYEKPERCEVQVIVN